MTWTTRTLLALLTTLLGAIAGGVVPIAGDATVARSAVAETAQAPSALVAALTAEQEALLASSLDRFTQAGLAAPDHVVASFHKSLDACNGNLGLRTTENGVSRVRVCWAHENPGIELRLQEQALIHELAHAWADRNIDDARRDSFVEFTGASSWGLAADAWDDRGTEQAADLITWALLDPAVLFIEFDESECHTWAPAFELLTGAEAPAPLANACDV